MKKLLILIFICAVIWFFYDLYRTDDWVDGKTGKTGHIWGGEKK